MATAAPRHVVVVGAGISGLTCAFKLSESEEYKSGRLRVTLLEGSGRAGGIIQTDTLNGCILESGPDSFITNKPYMVDLAKRLGIDSRIVGTRLEDRGAMVVCDGKLVKLPDGFSLMAPTKLLPFLGSSLLSPLGKIRVLLEMVLPGRKDTSDETLADFVRRRFGRELFQKIAQPMVGGIYVGDAERLSAAMTAERFVSLERERGSVIRGLIGPPDNISGATAGGANAGSAGVRYGLFCSFDEGMGVVVDALMNSLKIAGVEVRLSCPVSAISNDSGWSLTTTGSIIHADEIVLALPAARSAALLATCAPALASDLSKIEAASSAVVTMILDWSDISATLDAFGVVVPEVEMRRVGLSVIALSFASKKFARRAPKDLLVLRAFLGGSKNEALLEEDDTDLCARVVSDLVKLIGYRKGAAPIFMNVSRWPNSMPQFAVGHRVLLQEIEQKLKSHPGLNLAGASYRGVGLPECVNSGELCAEKILYNCSGLVEGRPVS